MKNPNSFRTKLSQLKDRAAKYFLPPQPKTQEVEAMIDEGQGVPMPWQGLPDSRRGRLGLKKPSWLKRRVRNRMAKASRKANR